MNLKRKLVSWPYILGLVLCLLVMGGIVLFPFAWKIYQSTFASVERRNSAATLSSIKDSLLGYFGVLSEKPAYSKQPQPMPMSSMREEEQLTHAPVQLNLGKQQLLGIETTAVAYRSLDKSIKTVGTITHDETKLTAVSLKVGGWIGKLYADYTGKFVREGDPLFTIYSPDLVSTQEEYLLALRTREKLSQSSLPDAVEGAERLVQSSRRRLLLWDITEDQIAGIAMAGKANTHLTFFSPVTGYVLTTNVAEGMYVNPGETLYKIVDLSRVWVEADIYEYEAPFVRVGQQATITLPYQPGKTFQGEITYVYPHLDPNTRTVKVRLELANPDMILKPQMYADVELRINVGKKLVVADSAVIHSGVRKLVFVARENGVFEPREIKLGAKVGNYYEVLEGLSAGQRIVTSGNFLLDSESRLMAATGGMKGMMAMIGMGDAPMQGATMGGMGGMEGMEGMGGMGQMGGMQGMGGMEGMEPAKGGMTGMKGMEGMMEGMEPVKPKSGMKGMSGMEGMEEVNPDPKKN